ncbi:hypothetical protein PVK06_021356 [Gossypium arboreum]|uniref:Uncharacterized protein n=1 Tax=Gossypium arboreum TaxID=29729 RepID=A0ABR0PPR8_GOSAR|nr:hypothetical protein PVK06_021356 [Gossypium arboreum]
MSISDFNIVIAFTDPDDVQADSYHTALLDIPSEYCLDFMGLLADTPTVYYFVPPSMQTARNNRVFRQRHNFATRKPKEQPPSFAEQRLSHIKAHLETMET